MKMNKGFIIAGLVATLLFLPHNGQASSEEVHLKKVEWPFSGIFGHLDKQAAQRGYQVYKEVCSACHSMNRVTFRNLAAIGFSEGEIKTIAADYKVTDGPNDQGEMFERSAKPFDHFIPAFPNEQAARAANGGAYPPDMSLLLKAREHGADYIYSIVTGFGEPVPADMKIPEGLYYNPYFPGQQIHMAPPLKEGSVTYQDGTQATVDQMARDVVIFLQWAAEPEMAQRKEMGIKVLLFLVGFTVLFYLAKKRVWARVE